MAKHSYSTLWWAVFNVQKRIWSVSEQTMNIKSSLVIKLLLGIEPPGTVCLQS